MVVDRGTGGGGVEWILGPFPAKKNGCFWLKMAHTWEGTSRLGAYAPGTGELWAQTSDLGRPCVNAKMARVE